MGVIRKAATIMLGRDGEDGLEILLLKRNKALAFAGGLWVFPGGKLEEGDGLIWDNELEVARKAAVREAEEETGVILQPEELIHFSHWTTPVVEPKRFATYFFFGAYSEEQAEVQIDDSEIKDHLWLSPELAIKKFKDQELAMLPPTLMSLQMVEGYKTVRDVQEAMSDCIPQKVLPVLQYVDGTMTCLYEGDAGYKDGDFEQQEICHRLIMNYKTGAFTYKYQGCDQVPAVNQIITELPIIEPIRIELKLDVMFPSVNCYLIPGQPLTLVDCGMGGEDNWHLLQEEIGKLGFAVSDIEQVVISHEHRDHIGLVPELLENTKAIFRVPKVIEGWFSRPEEMRLSYLEFSKSLTETIGYPEDKLKEVHQFINGINQLPTIEDMDRFEFFQEGDVLECGNGKWQVMQTPGHCPTQHVFYQRTTQRLISSDMFLALAPMPIVSEDPDDPGQPVPALKQWLQSLNRLGQLELSTIYPGHGPTFNNAKEVMERQLKRIDMRKQECYDAIKSGKSTAYEINREMYSFQKLPPDFSGLFMTLGYLDLLVTEGKVRHEMHNGVAKYYPL